MLISEPDILLVLILVLMVVVVVVVVVATRVSVIVVVVVVLVSCVEEKLERASVMSLPPTWCTGPVHALVSV